MGWGTHRAATTWLDVPDWHCAALGVESSFLLLGTWTVTCCHTPTWTARPGCRFTSACFELRPTSPFTCSAITYTCLPFLQQCSCPMGPSIRCCRCPSVSQRKAVFQPNAVYFQSSGNLHALTTVSGCTAANDCFGCCRPTGISAAPSHNHRALSAPTMGACP